MPAKQVSAPCTIYTTGLTPGSIMPCVLDLDLMLVSCSACVVKPTRPVVVVQDTGKRQAISGLIVSILRKIGYSNVRIALSEGELKLALGASRKAD